MSEFPLVVVEWQDIRSDGEWKDIADLSGPVCCESYGRIVHDGLTWLAVAGSVMFKADGTVEQVGNVDQIPRGCVVKITPLEMEQAAS